MKYFKNSKNELLVDPIESNHEDLTEITKAQFDKQIVINNTLTTVEKKAVKVAEGLAYLARTDYKMMPDYDGTAKDIKAVKDLRTKARKSIRANKAK